MRLSLLIALAALLAASTGQAVTLKVATLAPDGTTWMKMLRDGAKEVSQRTGGRVKLRFYPGGVMGNDKSVLRKIRIGQLQGGAITPGSLATIYKEVQVYSLPLLFRSFAEVDYVRKRMDPLMMKGIERNDFISFGFADGGFAYLMSANPLVKVDQVKGQKVWVPEGDQVSKALLSAFDVSPIQLPLTDVLTGLQTGLIDTSATSPIAASALQWHTRVKYLTNIPLIYIFGTLVIYQKALKSVSPADKQVLQEVMERVFRELDAHNRRDNERAFQALKKQGIKLVSPSSDETARWHKRVASTIEELGQRGFYSPAMLKMLRGYLRDYRKAHP